MKLQSLRARLIVIILIPLLVIALIAGAWQFRTTEERAQNIFDRGLLSAALAISRDVAVSGGDALSPRTRRLINDTSGGELFYHVYAPDGVFVTGYSTPPIPPQPLPTQLEEPLYYDALYQTRQVRVLRFQDISTVGSVSGEFNITVWQDAAVRRSFIREVVTRSFSVLALLVICVAFIVWFGVRLGLRPLLDLEQAIAMRTSTDLAPIRRRVPIETQGLVKTLNALLDQVTRRISSKDEFISNAAHQLRNPIAGVLALAEAVQNAPSAAAAKSRSAELVQAARETSQLTNQLLSFERARAAGGTQSGERMDLAQVAQDALDSFEQQHARAELTMKRTLLETTIFVQADPVMLKEAVLNLLSNAIVHGGPDMTEIALDLRIEKGLACLSVTDDGVGIPADMHLQARSRFGQAGGGAGTGLGLAIAAKVMDNYRGSLEIVDSSRGACVILRLPVI